MIPDKVIITITADGTNVTVFSGAEELSNRSSVMVSAGESNAKEKGDIHDDLYEEFEELAEEIEGIELGIFGIAGALYDIHGRE
jgi:hypothetical protein